MSHVAIPFASSEGQTAKVVGFLTDEFADAGHTVVAHAVEEWPADEPLGNFDGAIVAASIHMGTHQQSVRRFVREECETLATMPSAFVQVCLSSASDDPERQAEALSYIDELEAETGWTPDLVGSFAGALRFSEYGFLKKRLMKAIAADFEGVDPGEDTEFTDWDEVAAFATEFDSLLPAVDGEGEGAADSAV